MLPKNIISILQKYQNEVAEEISSINLATDKIKYELTSISSVLMDELCLYAKNTGIKNKNKEIELLKDSQELREFAESIMPMIFISNEENNDSCNKQDELRDFDETVYIYVIANEICPVCNINLTEHNIRYSQKENNQIIHKILRGYKCPKCGKLFVLDSQLDKFILVNTNIKIHDTYYHKIAFHDVVVIFNINKCSAHNHQIEDLMCDLPVILPSGEIEYTKVPIIHCVSCKRYVMLKSTYDNLKGVPICVINDESKQSNQFTENDFPHSDKPNSKLYQYGYNVNCIDKLTTEQRHTILLTQLLTHNLTKGEI